MRRECWWCLDQVLMCHIGITFRVTLLPDAGLIREVFSRIDRALSRRAGGG